MTTPSAWPEFDRPPAVAFVDVDGTLLAQTTTFLFARILYRRGWIRRSFLLGACTTGCNTVSADSTTGD